MDRNVSATTESLRLEKTFKIIKLNHQPNTASLTKTLMMASNQQQLSSDFKSFPQLNSYSV